MSGKNNQGNQESSSTTNQAGKKASQGAKKAAKGAYSGAKKSAKGFGHLLLLLVRYWWLGFGVIVAVLAMTAIMILITLMGSTGGNNTNPCTTGTGNENSNTATVKNAKNPSSNLAIQKIAKTARQIAPRYGVLPSFVLADAGAENPTNPSYNFWGLGYYDNSPVNDETFHSLNDGMVAFIKTAVSDTRGRILTGNAYDAMNAMSNADGIHPPEIEYHSDPSGDYSGKITGQYHTYNLSKYDKGIHLNKNVKYDNIKGIQVNTDNNSNGNCTSDFSNGSKDSIYNYASHFQGKISYAFDTSRRDEFADDLPNPKKSDEADCSSFIWGVLKETGYKVTNSQWNTKIMEDTSDLQHISASDARQGDILDIPDGDNAHTMILASDKWYGADSDKTQVIDEGGMPGTGSQVHVNQNSYKYAMGGTPQPIFLRAIKK